MGWMYIRRERGLSNLEFFRKEFDCTTNTATYRILDAFTKPRNVVYLLCEVKPHEGARKVFGMVCLVDWRPSDIYNFGYKDMDEDCHPYYYDCPPRFLDQMTEAGSTNANTWRDECKRVNGS